MKFFYFLAGRISYTFALAFLTIFGGWMGAVFGYYLGTSYTLIHYDLITGDIVRWLPLCVLIPTVLHYAHFGVFTPLRIPALQRSLRVINRNFTGDKLRSGISDDELKELYHALSDLPLLNSLSAACYGTLCGVLLLVFFYIDHVTSATYSPILVKVLAKMGTIAVAIVVILYGMSTYLISEIVTNHERATCFNELWRRGITQKPRVLLNLRVKFTFFVVLLVIALLTFAALIQKSIFYNE